MQEYVLFGLLGAASGALYALSALGIVLTYRGSGVINFASGAFGMVGAFCYWELADLSGWPPALAMVAGIGLAALLGWCTHLLMLPLKQASNHVRLVITSSILVVLEGVTGLKWNVQDSFPVNPLLPTGPIRLFGVMVGRDRMIIVVLSIVLTAILAAFYRYTRFGLATSAVAENKEALTTLGWSSGAVAGGNWALGGALSAFAAIMLVPITGLSVGLSTQLLLPALAAAVVGNLNSFSLSLGGGFLIGILQSEIAFKLGSIQGLGDAVPFAAIIVVIVVETEHAGALICRGTTPQVHHRRYSLEEARIRNGARRRLDRLRAAIGWVNAVTATLTRAIILESMVVITKRGADLARRSGRSLDAGASSVPSSSPMVCPTCWR